MYLDYNLHTRLPPDTDEVFAVVVGGYGDSPDANGAQHPNILRQQFRGPFIDTDSLTWNELLFGHRW